MAQFSKILTTLRKEEKQLAKQAAQVRAAIDALTAAGAAPASLGKGKGRKKKRKVSAATRAKMTAAQKKAVSRRMKKYWANRKKASTKSAKS